MTANTFNPLAAARDLKAAGIGHELAEAIAEGMHRAATATPDELATKADLAEFRAGTKADLAEHRVTTINHFHDLVGPRVGLWIIIALMLWMVARVYDLGNDFEAFDLY